MEGQSNHFYIYPQDKNGKRTGHTICVLSLLDPVDGSLRTFYGTALCSESDVFAYKTGRELAHNRALASYERFQERRVRCGAV
jgi:hypothetical protein